MNYRSHGLPSLLSALDSTPRPIASPPNSLPQCEPLAVRALLRSPSCDATHTRHDASVHRGPPYPYAHIVTAQPRQTPQVTATVQPTTPAGR